MFRSVDRDNQSVEAYVVTEIRLDCRMKRGVSDSTRGVFLSLEITMLVGIF